jgi:hypothetical protein
MAPRLDTPKNRTEVIINQRAILIAVAGASLLAAPLARSQSFGYSADDLLLNFRNTASTTADDLEVNLGPISVIAAFQGTEVVVPSSVVQSVYGPPNTSVPIGLSAAAADASGTTGTLWLTRADSTPGSVPTPVSAQQLYSVQNLAAARIANIGEGANGGTILAQGQSIVTGSTSGFNYQAQAEQSTSEQGQSVINYGGDENVAQSKGGNIESVQDGSAPIYEALWEVPITGTPDTYLGYFTFNTDGEVDYTSASVTVSEPPVSLTIVSSGLNSVTVLWPNIGNYTLQQNSDLASAAGWSTSGYSITTSNGTNSISITPATGNLFFRLATP